MKSLPNGLQNKLFDGASNCSVGVRHWSGWVNTLEVVIFLGLHEIKLPAMWDCNYALNVYYLFVCLFFGCVSLFGVTRLFWCAGAVSSFMAEWRELFDEGKTLKEKLLVRKSRDDLYVEMKGFEIQRFVSMSRLCSCYLLVPELKSEFKNVFQSLFWNIHKCPHTWTIFQKIQHWILVGYFFFFVVRSIYLTIHHSTVEFP